MSGKAAKYINKCKGRHIGMKKNLSSRFVDLAEKLKLSYDKEYSSDEHEFIENKKIKLEIVGFILDASSCGESLFVERAFKLLLDNTGCQEDFEILEEVLSPVLEGDMIDRELMEKYLKESPLSRWL
ncbi:hypothetical protein [Pectobacterium polaris]|uniref:hypothetical protein n=1 Tax=Pectobacterium polaris TaxID=2042057 RepID=UPI002406E41A|nr:hypothetical protein [Pectobacterium polaris]MDG0803659.1 hypothetical protein [Pectobacterium polaris]